LAALVHDIGALSMQERLDLIETESENVHQHAFIGEKLLVGFKPLEKASRIIKYHHMPWNNGEGRTYMGEDVPIESHVIHLADRICVLLHSDRNIISMLPKVLEVITKQVDSIFEPSLIDAVLQLSIEEYIWLDLISVSPIELINDIGLFNIIALEIDDIIDLSYIFSQIIDFRSDFTARHSAGVAKTAEQLAKFVGFSPYECKMMLVAGYLHDLGKIAIDNNILEKNGKLDELEFNAIRMHTYYTYRLLERIPQFNLFNKWASFHHEKLNGTGYPFHIKGDNIPLGSRIMAVADVFTAIKEDRPYRLSMSDDNTKNILRNMVKSGAIDNHVVEVLIENYQTINEEREFSQKAAEEHYNEFMNFQVNVEI